MRIIIRTPEERKDFLKKIRWKRTDDDMWIDPEEKAPPVSAEDAMTITLGRMLNIPASPVDPENVKRLRRYF